MKKILPFEINIPIKTYNYIAFSLSILYGNYDNADDWLFINGFNLKYGTGASDVTLNLPSNMNWECFDKKLLNNVDINNDDIIKEINEGRYVYLAVDEKFVPNRANYMIKSITFTKKIPEFQVSIFIFFHILFSHILHTIL